MRAYYFRKDVGSGRILRRRYHLRDTNAALVIQGQWRRLRWWRLLRRRRRRINDNIQVMQSSSALRVSFFTSALTAMWGTYEQRLVTRICHRAARRARLAVAQRKFWRHSICHEIRAFAEFSRAQVRFAAAVTVQSWFRRRYWRRWLRLEHLIKVRHTVKPAQCRATCAHVTNEHPVACPESGGYTLVDVGSPSHQLTSCVRHQAAHS